MASSEISGVRIAGIASAVPNQIDTLESARFIDPEEARKIAGNVGVWKRRTAPKSICTSDLCFAAAERLMRELGWSPKEISGVIFVTQTPDYIMPATSHLLHNRLGLPASCYAFDINLGCSGYVYGLWVAASLMQTVPGKTLLLVGETNTKVTSPQDRGVALLFGDAGTATALVSDPEAPAMFFEMGADGSGAPNLIIPAGGFRRPHDGLSGIRTEREGGNIRSDEDLFMDGPEIFVFTLRRVPGLVAAVLRNAGCKLDDIDWVVFHQANRFLLEHLAARIKIPAEKFARARGFWKHQFGFYPLGHHHKTAGIGSDVQPAFFAGGFRYWLFLGGRGAPMRPGGFSGVGGMR
jgi:3-oxoacyl-[acyl-carrier-protein] synthase-3